MVQLWCIISSDWGCGCSQQYSTINAGFLYQAIQLLRRGSYITTLAWPRDSFRDRGDCHAEGNPDFVHCINMRRSLGRQSFVAQLWISACGAVGSSEGSGAVMEVLRHVSLLNCSMVSQYLDNVLLARPRLTIPWKPIVWLADDSSAKGLGANVCSGASDSVVGTF